MNLSKFKYNELALLNKGFLKVVKIGIKFDSKVKNKKKNKSGVSYYVDGYEIRNWCFQEELKKINILDKLLIWIFRIKP
jgi:hypothetical protein